MTSRTPHSLLSVIRSVVIIDFLFSEQSLTQQSTVYGQTELMFHIFQNQFKTVREHWFWFGKRFQSSFIKMEKDSHRVVVKHFKDETRFTFSFHVSLPDFKIDRQFNLNRELSEGTEGFLERINNNLNKSKKKKSQNFAEVIKAEFSLNSSQPVSAESYKTVNDFIFLPNLHLNICDLKYVVIVNPPLVSELKISNTILTDLMIYPIALALDFSDEAKTKIEWFVSQTIPDDLVPNPGKKTKLNYENLDLTWSKLGEGFFCTPSASHINRLVKCVVTPHDSQGVPGLEVSKVIDLPVTSGPGHTPAKARQVWTASVLPQEEFRVVSYNILADLYADSDYSRTVLFAQCPPYALAIDYRVKLILSELVEYNSDLLTLQECDRKVFERDLQPILERFGLAGHFAKKGGQVDEGLATFYRREKFRVRSFDSVFLPDALHHDQQFRFILDKVSSNVELLKSLTNRTTTVSICVLEHLQSGRLIVLGNTHLYFEPNADHIRLIQTEMCRILLENTREAVISQEDCDGEKVTVMLCGDFNSTPPFGVNQYLTTGTIGQSHPDWRSQEGQEVLGLELKHDQTFSSAAGYPKYTNYTLGFKDCLDYIWIERDAMEVKQVVPFPSDEELSMHVALPNIVFPSDHVPVIVDLKFK